MYILFKEDFCDEIYKGIRTLQYQDSFDYILCKLEDDVQIVQVIRVYDNNEYETIIPLVFGVIRINIYVFFIFNLLKINFDLIL